MKKLGITLWLLLLIIIILGQPAYAVEDTDYDSQYDYWFNVWEGEFNLPTGLLKAVATHESGLDPDIIGCSGDLGLMQINPKYMYSYLNDMGWEWEFEWTQPRDNIMLGAFILSQNLKYYNGDINKALSAYNAGIGGTNKNGIRWVYVNKIEWERKQCG